MSTATIGERIRQVRQKRGLTMRQLGDLIGLSQPQISRLENGFHDFRSSTLARFATALGVDPEFLMQEASDEGRVKRIRLDAITNEALAQTDFQLLVRQLARSYAGDSVLYRATKALSSVL